MVLAKDKNEKDAMRWLIRSAHLYPMNWGCWLEMTGLIGRIEDVIYPPNPIYRRKTNKDTARSNSYTLATKHTIIHLPSAYLSRIVPINARAC